MKKNKVGITFLIALVLISLACAIEIIPQGNLNLKDYYNITNVPYYNGTTINITGLYYGNGSQLTGLLTADNEGNWNVNSSNYWDSLNSPSDISVSQLNNNLNWINSTYGNITYYELNDFDIDDYSKWTTIWEQIYNETEVDNLLAPKVDWTTLWTQVYNETEINNAFATIDEPIWTANYTAYNESWSEDTDTTVYYRNRNCL